MACIFTFHRLQVHRADWGAIGRMVLVLAAPQVYGRLIRKATFHQATEC